MQVQLSAGPVRVRVQGDGPVLLFVHGILVDGSLWDPVLPRLARRYRCVVPDWPLGAHRVPMRDDADLSLAGLGRLIVELCEALDLSDVTLVTNDTGTAIAQVLAPEDPARIRRLVLTNGDTFDNIPAAPFKPLQAIAQVSGARWAFAQATRWTALLRLPMAYGALSRRRLETSQLQTFARSARADRRIRRDGAKVLDGMRPAVTLAAAQRASAWSGATLVAWGTDDAFFPPGDAERLATSLDADLEWIGGARTYVMVDQPDRLAVLIESFSPRRTG